MKFWKKLFGPEGLLNQTDQYGIYGSGGYGDFAAFPLPLSPRAAEVMYGRDVQAAAPEVKPTSNPEEAAPMVIRSAGRLLMQKMTLGQSKQVLWEAGNRLLEDKKILEDVRPYVGEYMGRLFDSADDLYKGLEATGQRGSVEFCMVRNPAYMDQRVAHGDSSLPDMKRDLPFDSVEAWPSTEAIMAVEGHLTNVVYERFKTQEG